MRWACASLRTQPRCARQETIWHTLWTTWRTWGRTSTRFRSRSSASAWSAQRASTMRRTTPSTALPACQGCIRPQIAATHSVLTQMRQHRRQRLPRRHLRPRQRRRPRPRRHRQPRRPQRRRLLRPLRQRPRQQARRHHRRHRRRPRRRCGARRGATCSHARSARTAHQGVGASAAFHWVTPAADATMGATAGDLARTADATASACLGASRVRW